MEFRGTSTNRTRKKLEEPDPHCPTSNIPTARLQPNLSARNSKGADNIIYLPIGSVLGVSCYVTVVVSVVKLCSLAAF